MGWDVYLRAIEGNCILFLVAFCTVVQIAATGLSVARTLGFAATELSHRGRHVLLVFAFMAGLSIVYAQ